MPPSTQLIRARRAYAPDGRVVLSWQVTAPRLAYWLGGMLPFVLESGHDAADAHSGLRMRVECAAGEVKQGKGVKPHVCKEAPRVPLGAHRRAEDDDVFCDGTPNEHDSTQMKVRSSALRADPQN